MRIFLGNLAAAAVLVAAGSASAGTISFMQAVSGSTGSLTGSNVDFRVPDFNPQLGMLTGLSITFTGTVTDQVVFEPDGSGGLPPAGTYTAVNNSEILGGGFSPSMFYTLASSTFVLPANDVSATSTTNNVSYTAVLSGIGLSQYDTGLPFGYEPLGLDFGFNLFDANGNRVVAADGETTFNVNAVETYTYTAVPEPGSLALCAAGLLSLAAIGFTRRRRIG